MAGIIIGLIFVLGGGAGVVYGMHLNNDIEAQLASIFGSGKTDPGTVYIIIGIILAVLGIVFVILGAVSRLQKAKAQVTVYQYPPEQSSGDQQTPQSYPKDTPPKS